MLRFETRTTIAAPPERVWATLLQTDRWSDWGAGIERVEGRLGPGEHLVLHVAESSRPFRLRVTDWQPEQRIELRGGLPLGLFVGRRSYRVSPEGGGSGFEMVEIFSGPLAGLIGRTIPDLQPSFDAFAAGLLAAAETVDEIGQATTDHDTPGGTHHG